MSKNSELLLGSAPHYNSSPFGYRIHPITKEPQGHNGNDYATYKKNPPILCPYNGEILKVGKDQYGALFFYVGFKSLGYIGLAYHCKSIAVKKGQKVNKGDILGYVGTTGRSTGEHLHWSWIVWNDKALKYYEADYEDFELFKEAEDLTKEETIVLIKEVLSGTGAEPSTWAKESWNQATKDGIIDGKNPKSYPTKEQVILMIERAKEK